MQFHKEIFIPREKGLSLEDYNQLLVYRAYHWYKRHIQDMKIQRDDQIVQIRILYLTVQPALCEKAKACGVDAMQVLNSLITLLLT